jgi:hypothetical protein
VFDFLKRWFGGKPTAAVLPPPAPRGLAVSVEPATGLAFPAFLCGWLRERDLQWCGQPGLGHSLAYGHPTLHVKASVYVYDLGLSHVPEAPHDPLLQQHFQQVLGDVYRLQEHHQGGADLLTEATLTLGEAPPRRALHAVLQLRGGDRGDCLSHALLLGYHNQFLKVRVTYPTDARATAEEDVSRFFTALGYLLDDRPPNVRGREDVILEFGISAAEFDGLHTSYLFALAEARRTSGWNDEIDGHARALGALTEAEIRRARTDMAQAVLNRVVVRLAANRQGEEQSR